MKRVIIIPKNKAESIISKSIETDFLYYYFTDDCSHYINLRDKFADKTEIRNLSGLFDITVKEVKASLLELIAKLNKKHDSLEWWGGQIASKSTTTTQVFLNIVYLFCIKKLFAASNADFVFIVNSPALADCIEHVAAESGFQVFRYKNELFEYTKTLRRWLFNTALILRFLWKAHQSRRAAFRLLKPVSFEKKDAVKRVVQRSWVTDGTFDEAGKFKDRNFGSLPDWLRSKNYEIFTLPMFFNLRCPVSKIYTLMSKSKLSFLIPEHYLAYSDYLKAAYNAFSLSRTRVNNVWINKTDVTPILNETLKERSIDTYPFELNLCYPLLKKMKEKGVEIDSFHYAFENNSTEKQFLLGCRQYFPDSEVIGFQHTVFFPDYLPHNISPDEKDFHPLPGKIVCSGRIYTKFFREAGFPPEILISGPNLRYEGVYIGKPENKEGDGAGSQKIILLLPLSFSYDLAFDLFIKVKEVLKLTQNYMVYIKNHPLLSKDKIIKFLSQIGMNDFKFADDGTMQDWLMKSHAVISTGGSVTILESIIAGVPVIRVIPDNTFFYDPFAGSDYPLKPVNTAAEITEQLNLIEDLKKNNDIFGRIAEQTFSEYFTKPDEENMGVFL